MFWNVDIFTPFSVSFHVTMAPVLCVFEQISFVCLHRFTFVSSQIHLSSGKLLNLSGALFPAKSCRHHKLRCTLQVYSHMQCTFAERGINLKLQSFMSSLYETYIIHRHCTEFCYSANKLTTAVYCLVHRVVFTAHCGVQ